MTTSGTAEPMGLIDLALRPGDRAWAQGKVVQVGDRLGLVCLEDREFITPGGDRNLSSMVLLEGTGSDALLGHLGRRVRVSGTWTGTALTGPRVGTEVQVPRVFEPRRPLGIGPGRPPVRRSPVPAVQDLWDSGALLWLLERHTSTGIRVDAVTDDVPTVRRALLPLYGDGLVVTESHWPARVLESVFTAVRSGPDRTLRSVGQYIGDDLQVRVRATLLYLHPAVADALVSLPQDAFEIDTLVEPEGTRLPT